tara:strand:+ start:479 stop:880 length:402 start_codon:yes stop_codon:yes gene_type:complete
MNEIELLTKIEGLEKAIKEHDDMSVAYKNNLKEVKQELVDLHKPELTTSQAQAIERAVEQAVNTFDFSDTDNFEIDYSLDYDGRVQCESHEFINGDDLINNIVDKVCGLFKEVEELDTTEDDNHKVTHVEKII